MEIVQEFRQFVKRENIMSERFYDTFENGEQWKREINKEAVGLIESKFQENQSISKVENIYEMIFPVAIFVILFSPIFVLNFTDIINKTGSFFLCLVGLIIFVTVNSKVFTKIANKKIDAHYSEIRNLDEQITEIARNKFHNDLKNDYDMEFVNKKAPYLEKSDLSENIFRVKDSDGKVYHAVVKYANDKLQVGIVDYQTPQTN